MRRSAKLRRGCLWALLVVAVLVALVPSQGMIWDGKFPDVECRLKFVGSDGKPVQGVTLTVLTKAGGPSHYYPVDEFVPDQPVVSDANGQMIFHHSAKYLEFSGHVYFNLIGMPFGETSAPHYDCVFTLDGREVFRTPHNFHRKEWEQYRQPSVTRSWKPIWTWEQHAPRSEEERPTWHLRHFDSNHDGKIDREEGTARSYCEWMAEEKPRDCTYLVVARLIVISNP